MLYSVLEIMYITLLAVTIFGHAQAIAKPFCYFQFQRRKQVKKCSLQARCVLVALAVWEAEAGGSWVQELETQTGSHSEEIVSWVSEPWTLYIILWCVGPCLSHSRLGAMPGLSVTRLQCMCQILKWFPRTVCGRSTFMSLSAPLLPTKQVKGKQEVIDTTISCR